MDKVELGQVCAEYVGFPCQFSFRLLHAHLSSGAGTMVADVPSELSVSFTQSDE
jgi:hypothetical protein